MAKSIRITGYGERARQEGGGEPRDCLEFEGKWSPVSHAFRTSLGMKEGITGTLTFTSDPESGDDAVKVLCEHKKDGVCRSQPVLEDCPGEERCVSWLQRELAAARTVRAEERGLRARLIAVQREAVGYRNRALKAEAQCAEERKGERVVEVRLAHNRWPQWEVWDVTVSGDSSRIGCWLPSTVERLLGIHPVTPGRYSLTSRRVEKPKAKDHTMACRLCGERFDMRDLDQVVYHEQNPHRPLTDDEKALALCDSRRVEPKAKVEDTSTPDPEPKGDAVDEAIDFIARQYSEEDPLVAAARAQRAEEQGLRARLIAVQREAVGYRNRALKAEAQCAEEREGERGPVQHFECPHYRNGDCSLAGEGEILDGFPPECDCDLDEHTMCHRIPRAELERFQQEREGRVVRIRLERRVGKPSNNLFELKGDEVLHTGSLLFAHCQALFGTSEDGAEVSFRRVEPKAEPEGAEEYLEEEPRPVDAEPKPEADDGS